MPETRNKSGDQVEMWLLDTVPCISVAQRQQLRLGYSELQDGEHAGYDLERDESQAQLNKRNVLGYDNLAVNVPTSLSINS